MHHSILKKIERELVTGISTEAQVMYLLAQIRKCFEYEVITSPAENLLKFYCDWALHTKLKGPSAQTMLSKLSSLNEFYQSHPTSSDLPQELAEVVWETISLDDFRDALADFLHAAQLPDDIIRKVSKWHDFLRQYLYIIEDCPLNLRSDNATSSLSEVIVNISEACPINIPDRNQIYSLTINWTFVGKDGQFGKLNNHMMIPREYM